LSCLKMSVLGWRHMASPHSSPVDWCEDNYMFSPHIAEFVNTVSNVIFLVMPPILMRLHRPYADRCGPGIHVIWALLIVVGASSAYFHATLSLVGQLLDELAILWVIMAGFAMWYPRSALPPGWKRDPEGRRKFSYLIISFSFISTFLGFLQPAVNAPCLLLLGIPAFILMVLQLKVEEDNRVISLGKRSIFFWVLAVTCWINDKIFCDVWVSVGFPYLHGVWHILIFLASYTAIVLFAYFDVKNHMPWETPLLRYYPVDDFQLGIPYVLIKKKEYTNGNGKNHQI